MLPTTLTSIRRRLLGWYKKNKRDLPWRRTSDPYAIWISETMLQQTQVKTVLPYYEKFLKSLPTVAALNQAPLRNVLRLWSGLGYYRRAENLKKAARVIMHEHGGKIPPDHGKLRALPGVGEYTAGAVLSIAFEETYPALDGNVRRVLGRVFNLTDSEELRITAQRLVPELQPGNFNQSLMELGATICLPREPRCVLCPLELHCLCRSGNGATKKAAVRRKQNFTDVTWPLAIVRRDEKILLRRRSKTGLLAGLWELPGGEKPVRQGVFTTIRRHLDELDMSLRPHRRIGEIRHNITHRRIRAPIFLIEVSADENSGLPASRWRWVAPAALDRYPVSSMTLKAAELLASYEKSSS